MPIINHKFIKYNSFHLFNSGYFNNGSFLQLQLPKLFIQNGPEIIGVSNNCQSTVCTVRDLLLENNGQCIANIMNNKPLNVCKSKIIKETPCIVTNTPKGILLTAESGLIVYQSKTTKIISRTTDIVFGQGNIVCQIAKNESKTILFNTEPVRLNTFIHLESINSSKFASINITLQESDIG